MVLAPVFPFDVDAMLVEDVELRMDILDKRAAGGASILWTLVDRQSGSYMEDREVLAGDGGKESCRNGVSNCDRQHCSC